MVMAEEHWLDSAQYCRSDDNAERRDVLRSNKVTIDLS